MAVDWKVTVEELIATLQEIAKALPGAEVVVVSQEETARPPIIAAAFGRVEIR
jgi:hypothetical protein